MAGTFSFAIAYMLGGEAAARLLDFALLGLIVLLLVRILRRWAPDWVAWLVAGMALTLGFWTPGRADEVPVTDDNVEDAIQRADIGVAFAVDADAFGYAGAQPVPYLDLSSVRDLDDRRGIGPGRRRRRRGP